MNARMNARIIRMKKEARALFWPWCAVVIAGALPVILSNSYAKKLNLLSFFVGVPLLAALSLGNEFQQRTLSLWLTQPASRMRVRVRRTSANSHMGRPKAVRCFANVHASM